VRSIVHAPRTTDYAKPMSHPFDLVILDLDGTILDLYRAEAVSPAVRAAIAAVQDLGIPVTVGTGRTLAYLRQHLAHLLDLRTPAVTTQGAVIGEPQSGRILHEVTMPLAAARRLAEWVEREGETTVFYFNEPDGETRLYQNIEAVDPQNRTFHEHVFGAPRLLVSSFLPKLNGPNAHPPLKFIIDNDPSLGPDLTPILQREFGADLYITRTHPRLVEGTALGVDKGQGVLTLCRLLGIDPVRVLAIGDNDNDIPMLEVVGYGVAMGNATPGVKAVAKWVAPPIGEDGVAVALRKLVLDR
jgi:Cof subfamily protein (haloacid dehalogenase superfamily)